MWFQLLGFDILIDYMLKPWLLEVNHAPSFSTDTPLDYSVKQALIADTLTLLGIKAQNRVKTANRIRQQVTKASLLTRNYAEIKLEKQKETEKAWSARDKFIDKKLVGTGYIKIYSESNAEEYAKFI